jgi:hypothetical protein
MLLRASNALGYANYPDNLVKSFVHEATQAGMDVYRVFDSLNWLPNMKLAMESVVKSGAICEAAICYSGDILDKEKTKYDLKYYVELAKELEKMGAHILAIKDMAGLCKPYAAELLVKTLKQEIGIPIHFHTHDTSGVQAAAIIKGAEQKLDIADAAFAPLSGLTSQPNLNSVVEALRYTKRDTKLDAEQLQRTAEYWEVGPRVLRAVRKHDEGEHGRRLLQRNARRTVHEPLRAGRSRRPRPSLARNHADVRRREPAARRHREGDAVVEGRRRYGALHDRQQPHRGRRARRAPRLVVPRISDRPALGPHGPAARGLSEGDSKAHPARRKAAQGTARRQPAAGRLSPQPPPNSKRKPAASRRSATSSPI